MKKDKDHADFQDEYKQSSNFPQLNEDEDLEIKGDGKLKLEKDAEMKAKSDKKKITDILKNIDSEEE